MKIVSLHIYGFGQFEDKWIEMKNGTTFQAIYGNNEAGKSTIMAFIQAILFGFPTRNQSENRYEPKTGGRYGGKIILQSNEETITIERTAGSAVGDVTVYFSDGTKGGEDDLLQILGGFDRSIYQSIFSFGLKGLQNVDHLQADDLGHYLFSAGSAGSQDIFELEKKLDKNLDELYKPNGRKPKLNQRLSKLEHIHSDLKKWQENTEKYNTVVNEKEELNTALAELETQRNERESAYKQYEKKRILQPYVEDRRQLLLQLEQMNNYKPFPTDGIERLEKYTIQLAPLTAQLQIINEKLKEVEESINKNRTINKFDVYEPKVRSLKEKFSAVQLQQKELEKLIVSLRYEEDEIAHMLEQLGGSYSEEVVQRIEISLHIKEQLNNLVMKKQQLYEQQKFLDEQFKTAKSELELAEQSIQKLIQHQADQTETVNKNSQYASNIFMIFFYIIAVITIGLTFYLFDFIYTVFVILVVGLLAFIIINKTNKNKASQNQEQLVEREKIIVAQKEQGFESIVNRIENWEQEFRVAEEALDEFCLAHQLPTKLSGAQLLDAFQSIENLKKRIRTKRQFELEIKRLEAEIQTYYTEVQTLANQFLLQPEESAEIVLEQMTSKIQLVKSQEAQLQHQLTKEKELEDEKVNIEKQIVYFEEKIKDLYASANVDSEEDFRLKGKANEHYLNLSKQLQAINVQIQSLIKVGEEHYVEEIENELLDYNEISQQIEVELKQIKQDEKQLQLKYADLKVQIEHLENGTTYSDLLHRYSLEKSAYQEEIKEWATYQVARDLLQRTKAYYREVRLPQVIKVAEEYFSILTLGAYSTIYAPDEENGFVVERKDGVRFNPNELSQATTEQLYLSIRLALASTFSAPDSFPILIDDSFVNFDKHRTTRVMELLKKVAQKHHILFFTCHEYLLEYFKEDEIVKLS